MPHSMQATVPAAAGGYMVSPAPATLNRQAAQIHTLGTQQSTGHSGASDIHSEKQAVSELNTTVGGASRQQVGLERRVQWLEEDVSVLHRRLRDECGDATGASGGVAGDSGLRTLVARLDGELAQEKRNRATLEARLKALEETILQERSDRTVQMDVFQSELSSTMASLCARIDQGLMTGAAAIRDRTDQTETRLRSLIKRVDEGLQTGANALQETLSSTAQTGSDLKGGRRSPARKEEIVPSMTPQAGERLGPSMGQLKTEGQRLERHMQSGFRSPSQLAQSPNRSTNMTPAATPSLAYPYTMQVPGSGLTPAPMGGAMPGPGNFSRTSAGSPWAHGAGGGRPGF